MKRAPGKWEWFWRDDEGYSDHAAGFDSEREARASLKAAVAFRQSQMVREEDERAFWAVAFG